MEMFQTRIDLFGFWNAVMAVSNPFVKLDVPLHAGIHQKSHLSLWPAKVWWKLET